MRKRKILLWFVDDVAVAVPHLPEDEDLIDEAMEGVAVSKTTSHCG